jgi:DNA-binding ferritin-like protein (Dps family)
MTVYKDEIVQKVLDLIAKKQLTGETFPEMTSNRIDALSDSIIHELKDYSPDYPEQVDETVKWNLEQNLTHW